MSGTHHAAHLTAVVVDEGVDFSDEVVGREAQPVSRRLSARGSRFSPIVSHDAGTRAETMEPMPAFQHEYLPAISARQAGASVR